MAKRQSWGVPVLAAAAAGVLGLTLHAGHAAAQPSEEAFTRAEGEDLEWGACPGFMPPGCEIAVLQGDPSQPNADIFFRLPGGAKVARHWHRSAERMVLIRGELEVEYDGQDRVVLAPGTYAYGPAQLPHTADCRSTEDCLLFIAFEKPVDAHEGAPPP